jgi:hypothetical protein
MTRNITRPLGRPPVRLGERMHVQVKDYGGELFPEVLLAAIVRSSHSLIVEVIQNHPVWHGARLQAHQFVVVKE